MQAGQRGTAAPIGWHGLQQVPCKAVQKMGSEGWPAVLLQPRSSGATQGRCRPAHLEQRAARSILARGAAAEWRVRLTAVARGCVGVAVAARGQTPLQPAAYPGAHSYACLRLQLSPHTSQAY